MLILSDYQWARAPAFERGNVRSNCSFSSERFGHEGLRQLNNSYLWPKRSELKLQLLRYHARKLAHYST